MDNNVSSNQIAEIIKKLNLKNKRVSAKNIVSESLFINGGTISQKQANHYIKSLTSKPKKMATKKKATPAQLAARKNFAQMAKDGTLAKKRVASKKKGLNGSLPKGMTKSVAKAIKVTGLKKADGTLQKGYKYEKGGKIVKATSKK